MTQTLEPASVRAREQGVEELPLVSMSGSRGVRRAIGGPDGGPAPSIAEGAPRATLLPSRSAGRLDAARFHTACSKVLFHGRVKKIITGQKMLPEVRDLADMDVGRVRPRATE